jgi:hypothetical protein
MRLSEIDPEKVTPGSKQQLGIDYDPDVEPEEDETGRNVHDRNQDMIADYIGQHCSDILNLYKNTGSRVFYRGMSWPHLIKSTPGLSYKTFAFVGQSREDRRTKDSNSSQTQVFDSALANNGFKALRSNSVFVSSSPSVASDYGTIWVIFPFNGFDFTYTNRRDVVIEPSSLVYYPPELIPIMENWCAEQSPYRPDVRVIKANIEAVKTVDDESEWDNGHRVDSYMDSMQPLLREALKIYKETGDKRFAKMIGSRTQLKDFINPDAVMKYYRPKNTDLATPLIDQREVFLRCKYVAVQENYFKKYLYTLIL